MELKLFISLEKAKKKKKNLVSKNTRILKGFLCLTIIRFSPKIKDCKLGQNL